MVFLSLFSARKLKLRTRVTRHPGAEESLADDDLDDLCDRLETKASGKKIRRKYVRGRFARLQDLLTGTFGQLLHRARRALKRRRPKRG